MVSRITVLLNGRLEPLVFEGEFTSTKEEYVIRSSAKTEDNKDVGIFTTFPKTTVTYVQEVVVIDKKGK